MIIKIVKEIDVAEEIERIANIPSIGNGQTCHQDHEQMSEELEELADNIRESRDKKCESKKIKSKGMRSGN